MRLHHPRPRSLTFSLATWDTIKTVYLRRSSVTLSRAAVHSAAGTDYTGADGHLPSPPEEPPDHRSGSTRAMRGRDACREQRRRPIAASGHRHHRRSRSAAGAWQARLTHAVGTQTPASRGKQLSTPTFAQIHSSPARHSAIRHAHSPGWLVRSGQRHAAPSW